eukprot:COSAG02_NODE_31053_length_540_cov_0.832200_1_plen_144_part_10
MIVFSCGIGVCRAVRVSTIAGGVSHKHHKKRECNSWVDGNSTVARFNYVHGTAFQALSPTETQLSVQNPHGSLVQPGSNGGSRYLYVRGSARPTCIGCENCFVFLGRLLEMLRMYTHTQVCDEDNNRIRRIDLGTRVTTTLAGS